MFLISETGNEETSLVTHSIRSAWVIESMLFGIILSLIFGVVALKVRHTPVPLTIGPQTIAHEDNGAVGRGAVSVGKSQEAGITDDLLEFAYKNR